MEYFRSLFNGIYLTVLLHVVRLRLRYTAILLLLMAVCGMWLYVPPPFFPQDAHIQVEEGISAYRLGALLEERGLIMSAVTFGVLARTTGADEKIQAGTYRFETPLGVLPLLTRFAHGETGIPFYTVTFPEGMTVREMSLRLGEVIPGFDTETFRTRATPLEGYLFPETYHFPEGVTPEQVIARMQQTFEDKTAELQQSASSENVSFRDAVIIASLLEKEVRSEEDRRLVAGILLKRLSIDMPLQVDAVFGYIKGTATFHPEGEDLEIDSPYNTYKYKGLPPGPIGNPGLSTLSAALSPQESDYLFYLSGRDGTTHYASTFEEHKENKEKYLR